ncbi:MAG: lipoprotein [Pseudomonas sp.]|nr:lipoprotein [Pseudomonas sp.]
MRIRPLFAVAALASMVGCANDPAPTEQLRLTEQAVEQAKAVGANDEIPEMALAESKLMQAQVNMKTESFKRARMQAEQSELDARLAEARVLTGKSQEQLTQLDTRLVRLRKQVSDSQ